MVTKIYIENNLIDLFQDETIELTSSIANTSDISKINSDYTKTFTVPASERNNVIFKHYYDADIDNTFDARTKKNAKIEIDGFSFRKGKIRLEKVSVKSGKPSSYTINFWGDLVNFKDLIKDDKLESLDFSEYDHEQTSENVKEGLVNGLFDGDVIYNLLYKKQLFYDSSGQNTNAEKMANIAYDGGADTGIIWNELRPSIRVLSIIELIEQKYGILFSRDFFGRDEFSKLFLWVNNDSELNYFTEKSLQIDFTSAGNIGDLGNEVNISEDYYVCGVTASRLVVSIVPSSGYENIEYSLVRNLDGQEWTSYTNLTGNRSLFFRTDVDPKKHTLFVKSRSEFKFTTVLTVLPFIGTSKTATMAEQTITGSVNSLQSMPDIKIIDFLKGLFSLFKLIVELNEDGTVYVNTINDYYSEGDLHDISNYVDYESYDVERGVINNQIKFLFEEPQTILNQQFKINTGTSYGDESVFLKDSEGNLLDGDSLEIKVPFEQVVFERLTDQADNTLTYIQYGCVLDDKLERVNPKPVLFYNNVAQLSGNNIAFINDVGVREILNTTINTPSQTLGLDEPNLSLTYGMEFSPWNYAAISETLYRSFWETYISSIFNIKKRNFKYKAYLPTRLLTTLRLNDLLFIKDRYYRINDFTTNLLTGETSLNLINSFETNFGLFRPSQTEVLLNYKAQSYSVYVSNGVVMNIVLQDIGFGTSWATATQNGNLIVITVTENSSSESRNLFINVDNGSGKSFQIYLDQNYKIVTADSTTITADDAILTADAQ